MDQSDNRFGIAVAPAMRIQTEDERMEGRREEEISRVLFSTVECQSDSVSDLKVWRIK
jgi:hypothetical protein